MTEWMRLNRDIRGVGASAAAISGIPQAYLPGKSLMGLGVGGTVVKVPWQ